jgi:hypothetical protein
LETVIANFMTEELSNYKVTDRQSFIKFIDALHQDFLKNPNSWENKNLSDFLEAFSAVAEDMQGYYDNTKQDINADIANWQTFADLFKSATIYE